MSLSENQNGDHVLVIHIGSASVSAAAVTIAGNRPKIDASASVDIAILADLTFAQFEKEMERALEQSLRILERNRFELPVRAQVHFASPWYASQVRVGKMSRPTPFVVSASLLNDLISRELKAFEEEELSSRAGSPEPLRAIESLTVQVKLNGYAQNEPVGLSGRELETSLFLSVAPERMLSRIEELVTRHYHVPVSYGSFLSASYLVARDFFPHQADYLLLDIGGEVTDVSLVREGTLSQSISFPRGANFVLRKLSAGLGRSIAESASILTLYGEDKLEASIKEKCESVLASTKESWLESFQKAMFGISNELSIPDTVLVSVAGDTAAWFKEIIHHEDFHQYAHTEKDFKVVLLDATLFHEFISFGLSAPRDPAIMIEALAHVRLKA